MSIYFVWDKINYFLWFTLYFSYYFWSFFLYLNYSWSNNKKTLNYCVHSKAIRMRSMLPSSMVYLLSFSKQIATGSNDCMVFVWNLNTTGNIYKYIGHRVCYCLERMRLLMSNFHLWAISLPVLRRIRLWRYGRIMLRGIHLRYMLIMLPFEG
jgi:WD40 repeat protein